MADVTKHYVLRGDKSLVESMTKEEIETAIVNAIEQGEIGEIDTGFVTSLKEQNGGQAFKVWIGTQAQYNAIANPEKNVLYLITDDTTDSDLEEAFEELEETVENLAEDVTTLKTTVFDYEESHNTYADKGNPYLSALSLDIKKRSGWAIVNVGIVGNTAGAVAFNSGESITITGLPIPQEIGSPHTYFALNGFTTPTILSATIEGNNLIIRNDIETINMYGVSALFTLVYPYAE